MQECTDATLPLLLQTAFLEYFQLICTRSLLLPHDTRKRHGSLLVDDILECELFRDFFKLTDTTISEHFDVECNRFFPDTIRNIHRQYIQLDKDKNGMLRIDEMEEYGKKKAFNPIQQLPTHDLTVAFITQIFSECPTYPPDGEMDYKAYIDFTLLMADKTSTTSLRVRGLVGCTWGIMCGAGCPSRSYVLLLLLLLLVFLELPGFSETRILGRVHNRLLLAGLDSENPESR